MQIPSPLHQIVLRGNPIWIKRDDLIDPFISGNKWRKLKYILADVLYQRKSHLVTFGGAYSNHLLATAAAAAKNKLTATAFVRGEEVNNEILVLCKIFGMRLMFTEREAYKNKQALFDQYFKNDPQAYFIPEGGAGEAAVKGCMEMIDELTLPFDHIICAAGTGTTAAGILKRLQQVSPVTRLHVIPVLKGGEFIKDEIAKYVEDHTHLQLHTDYHFGGYAKTTPVLIDFIKRFTAETSILIDPIYTGKMMFALDDLLKANIIPKKSKVLAVHTGGLFGIFGKKDVF